MSVLAISKHGKALSDISKQSRAPTAYVDDERSFLSRFLFLWVGPILSKGAEKTIVYDDLPSLKQKHRSVNLLRYWKPSGKSLLNNLFWHYKGGLFIAIVIRLIAMVLDYVNPLLLKVLVTAATRREVSMTRGLTIAVLMFIVSEVKSLLLAAHMYIVNRDSSLAMSLMVNSVAKKSLRLAPEARAEWPSARIVNLVTVDAENISTAAPYLHFAWYLVLDICLGVTFIYWNMGIPALGAVIVLLLYIPFNIIQSRVVRALQVKQMKLKDQRVKFMKEIIGGIKIVKTYTWEVPFEQEIDRLRRKEISLLAKSALLNRIAQALNTSAPFILSVVCFTWFALTMVPGSLTPQVAFTSLIIFNMLRRPMSLVSPTIAFLTKGSVSASRLSKFLNSKELVKEKTPDDQTGEQKEVQLLLRHSYFSFNKEKEDLKDITLEVSEGSFHVIVGPVGCGKSALLASIIGDLNHLDGVRLVKGTMGYLSQTPWIMNQSVKSNVLYGMDFNKNKYEKITKACDLRKDFFNLPRYDSTVVGDNGVQLSGGQRARIALARAIYQDCDIYLLDDPFSALDANVARTVNTNLLGDRGLLAHKTVILATHNINLVKNADMFHMMENGTIVDSGTFEDLFERNEHFASLAAVAHEPVKPDDKKDTAKKRQKAVMFEPPDIPDVKKIESVQEGKIKSSVYLKYIQAFSCHYATAFILFVAARFGLQTWSGMWLSYWSDHNSLGKGTEESRSYYLQIFIAIGVGTVIIHMIALISCTFGGIRASIRLHVPLVSALLRAPLSFFDNTPIGRILSRISGDIDIIDGYLPLNIRLVTENLMHIAMVMAVISINIPLFVVFVIPFAIGYALLLKRFIPSSRQIRRIESAQRSSILSTLTQNVNGASSIRAFGRTKMTCLNFHNDVDAFLRCRYLQPATQRWLALRLELLGNFMVFACAILVGIGNHLDWISAGAVGLCISYSLTLTEVMNFSVRMINLTENNIVAVERVKEYHDIEPESSWQSDYPLIDSWPHSGSIEIMKYNINYNRETHALKDVTFSVNGGEKIGIVGRTGSGKSTLVAALLRTIEGTSGNIKIDGVNIREIGLHELRSRITIIPQEPSLFSSTLRFNIDPFDQFADSDIWLALEACQLKEFVMKQQCGLNWIVEEGGSNLSLGQRQLICLCRALLKGGQILILDEATAATDRNTEQLVHQVVSDHFKLATTLIIAHRLETIRHCDRILVLDDGRVAEFDEPDVLLAEENSLFREMSKQE